MARLLSIAQPERIDWMDSSEAAIYLKVTLRTVQKWAREGRIKGHHLPGGKRKKWYFIRAELDGALVDDQMVFSSSPSVLSQRRAK